MRFGSKVLLISFALGVLVLSLAFSSASMFTYDTYYRNQAGNSNSLNCNGYDSCHETSDYQSSSSSINDQQAGYSRTQNNQREVKTIDAQNYQDVYVYPSGYNNAYSYTNVKPGYDYHYISPSFSCTGGNCYSGYDNQNYVIHHATTCGYYGNCYDNNADYSSFRYQPFFADDYQYYNNYYPNNGNVYGSAYYYQPIQSSNSDSFNWRY